MDRRWWMPETPGTLIRCVVPACPRPRRARRSRPVRRHSEPRLRLGDHRLGDHRIGGRGQEEAHHLAARHRALEVAEPRQGAAARDPEAARRRRQAADGDRDDRRRRGEEDLQRRCAREPRRPPERPEGSCVRDPAYFDQIKTQTLGAFQSLLASQEYAVVVVTVGDAACTRARRCSSAPTSRSRRAGHGLRHGADRGALRSRQGAP